MDARPVLEGCSPTWRRDSLLFCCPCKGAGVLLAISIVAPLCAVAKEHFLDFCIEIDCVMARLVVVALEGGVPTSTRLSYHGDLLKHGAVNIKVWQRMFQRVSVSTGGQPTIYDAVADGVDTVKLRCGTRLPATYRYPCFDARSQKGCISDRRARTPAQELQTGAKCCCFGPRIATLHGNVHSSACGS